MSNFREELEKEQLCTGERRYTKCDIDSITSHHALKAVDRGEVPADVMDEHAIERARQRRERMIQSCIVKEKKLPTKRFNTDDY